MMNEYGPGLFQEAAVVLPAFFREPAEMERKVME